MYTIRVDKSFLTAEEAADWLMEIKDELVSIQDEGWDTFVGDIEQMSGQDFMDIKGIEIEVEDDSDS